MFLRFNSLQKALFVGLWTPGWLAWNPPDAAESHGFGRVFAISRPGIGQTHPGDDGLGRRAKGIDFQLRGLL